jgi:tRNA1Val (adenine37-N6)-methyltransferase
MSRLPQQNSSLGGPTVSGGPVCAVDALDLYVRPDEHCASLTRDFFLLQRSRGHRYSVDDLLVAHLACTEAQSPLRVLDLGCGIGSVLLMIAWSNPQAELIGVEAQSESIALARRNAILNDCEHRIRLHCGDLRQQDLLSSLGSFDLVTGTPPYFDPKAATPCSDPQRAHAKFELRGGIEEYALAAARVLAPGGLFVVCAPSVPPQRASQALQAAGLHAQSHRCVLPGPQRPAFIELMVAGRSPATCRRPPPLVLREADGRRSPEHSAIREWFGVRASE